MSIPYSIWLGNARLIVEAFASPTFQREAWTGEITSSFGSPDEMMCVYFDDVLVPDFIKENSDEIGEECATAGVALTSLLDNFPWPMDGEFISAEVLLNMPQWVNVCKVASIFLRCLPISEAA